MGMCTSKEGEKNISRHQYETILHMCIMNGRPDNAALAIFRRRRKADKSSPICGAPSFDCVNVIQRSRRREMTHWRSAAMPDEGGIDWCMLR